MSGSASYHRKLRWYWSRSMKVEIERRFLVADTSVLAGLTGLPITQGYLRKNTGGLSSRIRIAGEQAWLTMKTPRAGMRREEYEFPIPLDDARLLLERHCTGRTLEKQRFLVPCGDVVFEVDVFGGALRGLVIAEVELANAGQAIPIPPWLGPEITHDRRYGNGSLARHGHPLRDLLPEVSFVRRLLASLKIGPVPLQQTGARSSTSS